MRRLFKCFCALWRDLSCHTIDVAALRIGSVQSSICPPDAGQVFQALTNTIAV